MADATRTVLIDFQVNSDQLQSALDILVQTGTVDAGLAASFKKSNAEISKQAAELKKTTQAAGTLTQQTDKLTTENKDLAAMLQKLFTDEFTSQLKDYGLTLEQFQEKLRSNAPKEAADKNESFRTQLRLLREEMIQVAQTEGVLSQRYLDLKEKAGKLDDTMKDVAKDIANAGSDTRTLDNVVGSISAVAGAFSAAQGAVALFGDNSEDLQKALLKVNSAIAISTGLQQVANALTKEGALFRLGEAVATGFQTAAQKLYDVTLKGTIVSLGAFKLALAATGIGLAVVAVLALVEAFKDLGSGTQQAEEDLDAYNSRLELVNATTDETIQKINREIELRQLSAKTDKEKADLSVEGLNRQAAAYEKVIELENNELRNTLASQQALGSASSAAAVLGLTFQEFSDILKNGLPTLRDTQKVLDKIREVEASPDFKSFNDLQKASFTQFKNNVQAIADAQKNADQARFNSTKQSLENENKERERAAQKAKELRDKAIEDAKKQRVAEFEDFKAGVELQLLAVEKGSQEETDLRKKLAKVNLQIELENDKLTNNQRKLAIQQFFKEREQIQKDADKKALTQSLEDQKALADALLQDVNLNESDRLAVKTHFLELAAQEEIAQAEGNAAKIKDINAKLRADIAAATVESIKQTAEQEIALTQARGGVGRRALERVADDEKQKSQVRINAIRQIEAIEEQEVDRRIQANRDADKVIGANHQALELEYEQLLDQKAKITEDTEKKITGLTKAEIDKRKSDQKAALDAVISGVQQIGDLFSQIRDNENQRVQNSLELRKKELDDAIAAGAITERDATERRKRIEADERAAKTRAAQQAKQLAVFNSLLAIPRAYQAGLETPIIGAVVGPIFAALALAQAALIAARPLPKFFVGKKGGFEGAAIVHRGELIERNNNRFELVRDNEAITYLGSKDKVFTAGESKLKLEKMIIKQPVVNKDIITPPGASVEIDYEKITLALMKGIKPTKGTVINIDKEFISEAVNNGLLKSNYYDRYYSSK